MHRKRPVTWTPKPKISFIQLITNGVTPSQYINKLKYSKKKKSLPTCDYHPYPDLIDKWQESKKIRFEQIRKQWDKEKKKINN